MTKLDSYDIDKLSLPESWCKAKIRDFAVYVQRGKSPRYIDHSALPVVNQKCVRWSGIDTSFLKFIDPSQWSSWQPERFLQPGDILWNSTGTGTIGRAAMFHEIDGFDRAVVDSHITIVRTSGACLSEYLFFYIRSPFIQERINEMHTGSTNQVELSKTAVLDTVVPIAPLAEQKRISTKLRVLTNSLELCTRKLEAVELLVNKLRQLVLTTSVSGDLTKSWRQERSIPLSKDSTEVQSVARVGTGSTPLRSKPEFFSREGIPWITSSATGKPYVTSAEEFVTPAAVKAHRLKTYPKGTLLVAMYGEGKTRGQVTELAIPATINQACAAIVVDETKIKNEYLKLVLQANYLAMRALAEGGNQPNLNLTKIKTFRFPLPTLDEQVEIVNRANSLLDLVASIELNLNNATNRVRMLTPSILTKAFLGYLVSQDPSDEPAIDLLNKVKTTIQMGKKQTRGKSKTMKSSESKKESDKSILSLLRSTDTDLSPEEVFQLTGRDSGNIDDVESFFVEVRDLVSTGSIVEIRKGESIVTLRASK